MITRVRVKRSKSPRCGVGHAISHHGEILQGQFLEEDGQLHRALVTLPRRDLLSMAHFQPTSTDGVIVLPNDRTKAQTAASVTMRYLGVKRGGGYLYIMSNVVPGLGLGSSTADVVATIRATARAFGKRLSAEEIGKLAVASEIASDSTMFDRPVVFRQREGTVAEYYSHPLPPMEVIGFSAGSSVDTLKFKPAEYDQSDIARFGVLRKALRNAINTQNVALLGRVATISARINQRYLRKDSFEELEALVGQVGAVGLQVAHSGSVVGIIFDRQAIDLEARIDKVLQRLEQLGFSETWRFSV